MGIRLPNWMQQLALDSGPPRQIARFEFAQPGANIDRLPRDLSGCACAISSKPLPPTLLKITSGARAASSMIMPR